MVLTRFDREREALGELFADLPRYRSDQIWRAIYYEGDDPMQWTALSLQLRERVAEVLPTALTPVHTSISDDGDTQKMLWELADGSRIESVLMLYPDRATVCISTQAGCAMACSFCATGQAGFTRHLSVGEIVEQVARARQAAISRGRRLSNIVVMGMGEPLANERALWPSVERVHREYELSARHITVSTVGLVAGIDRLADRPLPVNLAVSLHAADDELRNQLVPINDRDSDAEKLASLCHRLSPSAHVNLIPLNPTPGYPVRGSDRKTIARFCDTLERHGVNVTVRRNRGDEIDAACGQLAAGQPVRLGRRPSGGGS
jgi:23S rRNA (adenine2503-C2)-methyltransferase